MLYAFEALEKRWCVRQNVRGKEGLGSVSHAQRSALVQWAGKIGDLRSNATTPGGPWLEWPAPRNRLDYHLRTSSE